MDYNYTTRNQLYKDFYEKNQPQKFFFGSENKDIFKIVSCQDWNYNQEGLKKYIDQLRKSGMEPSAYLRKYHDKLVDFCATNTYKEDFYTIVQKYNQFPYSRGLERRTVRTQDYGPSMEDIFRLLGSYYQLQFFDTDLSGYLKNEMTEEKLDFKNNMSYYYGLTYLEDMIAAALDTGNQKVVQTIKDIILGENNTAAVSIPLIRGIIKSSDSAMHKLLGDFLLAARLQEGVRQAVCENMDCGTEAAFRCLFQVIYENNLIRYSSVKRAVGTWIGVMDLEHTDRIMGKILDKMHGCIFIKGEIEKCIQSQDVIEIIVGLWCLGSHEVFDAVKVMYEFMDKGSRQQKLVMSYYNRELHFAKFSNEISMKVIEKYSMDMEMVAAFNPTYLDDWAWVARNAIDTKIDEKKENITVKSLHWSRYFSNISEAETHFEILRSLLSDLTVKKKTYAPFIFPWYQVELTRSEIIAKLCLIACMLDNQEKKDYATGLLTQLDSGYRGIYVKLLLHNAATPFQRECLLEALADRESSTRKVAFCFLKEENLQEEEYMKLLEMLRFKNHEIRQNILYLISKREDRGLEKIIKTLLEDRREEMRLAGLDLVLQLKKGDRKNVSDRVAPMVLGILNPTEREAILIEELAGKEEKEYKEGFGVYSQEDRIDFPPIPFDKRNYPLFSITEKHLKGLFAELDSFIHDHRDERVIDCWGKEYILGNCRGLPRILPWNQQKDLEESTAFIYLWKEFYKTYIKSFSALYAMYAAILPVSEYDKYEDGKVWEEYNCKLFGDVITRMDISGYRYGSTRKKSGTDIFCDILEYLVNLYWEEEYCRDISRKICSFLVHEVKGQHRWLKELSIKGVTVYGRRGEFYTSQYVIKMLTEKFKIDWKTDKDWKEKFFYLHEVDRIYDFDHTKDEESSFYYSYYRKGETWLSPFDYMKAYYMGIITSGQMYQILFEGMDLSSTLSCFKDINSSKKYHGVKMELERFRILEEGKDFDQRFYDLVVSIFETITDIILDIELKRGDTPTEMSKYVPHLSCVTGSERLKQMLIALGKDKLVRDSYADVESKAGSLSRLIRISRPSSKETAKDLARVLKGTKISKKRLVEIGMFAPDWLELLEEVMEMPGLKSGTYYFMAHMNDSLDEKKTAMIAKYTPLSQEELREGAFDINWFKDVQERLNEEQIGILYDAAKYISCGSKHTRARKYADASMGRLKIEDTKNEIIKKRNKDLLMALGLIPFQGKEDMLDRYEFIRAFKKDSKQFGAMRRSGEEHAADMALKNMALAAGYQDVTRLILEMESELTEGMKECFEWQKAGEEYLAKLELNGEGKVVILCQKGDKTLKSVPAALKKNELILSLKETQKKFKEQYRRTVSMLEKSMEDREAYSLLELKKLLRNPVTGTIIKNLIFTGRDNTKGICGLITDYGFTDREYRVVSAEDGLLLYVAHPKDLYQSGEWPEFQKLFFQYKTEENRVQPFRQVFRELYVKLEDEKKALSSKMFAGNQIQPARATACLKSRGWIADYEEGLQKIYYKDNVVARIYALADWFSPSDIEAPTLEWVEFSDRKTFHLIPVGEVPDILYSEVMRDVDLAVSVAHAGSVDPETSHSTLEMRCVIVSCNIELFNLTNVKLKGSYAMINGKTGEYNIHLGSGVIHKIGGHQINVLPVHSQNRGRIFLPFMDEDPKTAEIVSKILMFAEDGKIKDPYILGQILK